MLRVRLCRDDLQPPPTLLPEDGSEQRANSPRCSTGRARERRRVGKLRDGGMEHPLLGATRFLHKMHVARDCCQSLEGRGLSGLFGLNSG